MSASPLEYLQSIYDECTFILKALERGIGKDDFLNDELMKRAFVRSLEIMGEASKKVPADWKIKWNSIEWK